MHPGLSHLLQELRALRQKAGLSAGDVETQLVLGPGWVARFESGEVEPTLGTLAALLACYGSDLPTFFGSVDLGDTSVVLDRHLAATEEDGDLILHFPMGAFAARVKIPGGTVAEFNSVLLTFRNGLSQPGGSVARAIVACFLHAVQTWPEANPSDLWYFFMSHAYQDDYNHPAASAGKDWAQSWKRAGGWALEEIYVAYYNGLLRTHGIRLEMPDPARKRQLLREMGITDAASMEKSDVIAIGVHPDGREEPFGVVHVKASFAERRTDDVPLSQSLIAKGYASPLLTMDCKAAPSAAPYNRGELGPPQGSSVAVSSKRYDIERDRKFDACFSYNQNTVPTPTGQAAAARIHLASFGGAEDPFVRHMVRKWRDRQGLE